MQIHIPIVGTPRRFVANALTLLALTVFSHHSMAALRQSFDMEVIWRPVAVRIADQTQLVYELHLTNFASADLRLTRLAVVSAASGSIVADFRDDDLTPLIGRSDRTTGQVDKRLIPPGVRAVFYLSISFQKSDRTPAALTHRLEFVDSKTFEPGAAEGGRFTPAAQSLAPLGPPLRGGPWVAIYDSSWERGHRRVQYAVNGKVHVPGRFAIDWIKVDRSGKYADGDGSKLADWQGYGAEVLAVADGVVAAARDGIAENDVVSKTPAKVPLENASGNYVALKLDGQRYAFYEHLKPGSIAVKPGDRIRRGQVIGRLGYTGESTGPHLHFHISDNNSPLDAEGLPYALAAFKVLGSYSSTEAFAHAQPWTALPAGKDADRTGEMPGPFAVVEFPADETGY